MSIFSDDPFTVCSEGSRKTNETFLAIQPDKSAELRAIQPEGSYKGFFWGTNELTVANPSR